ncbi:MAG: alpha/beta fold hydrolase [Vicinamibacteria bacterium]
MAEASTGSRVVSLLKSLLRISVAVVVGATLFLMLFEKKLIYFPSTVVDITPKTLGLPFEDVWLDVEPGVKIHGWFIKSRPEPSRATVLFSHGNAGNISDRLDRVQSLRTLGIDFLIYDYRGFGQSTGAPDEEGTYRDGRASYDYLTKTRNIDPRRIVLMGESLGCAISMQLALDRGAAGLVLEAPFASIRKMAAAVYPFLPVGFFVRTRYDNLEKAPKLKVPLLVIHGTRDEVIPFEQGRAVFEAAPQPKTFISMDGAHHNDVYIVGGEGYRRALGAFVDHVVVTPPAGLVETTKP